MLHSITAAASHPSDDGASGDPTGRKLNSKVQAKRPGASVEEDEREVGGGRRGRDVVIHPDGAKALLTETAVLVKLLARQGNSPGSSAHEHLEYAKDTVQAAPLFGA